MAIVSRICCAFLVISSALCGGALASTEFVGFKLGRVEPQKLKINSKTSSAAAQDGPLGVYEFKNSKNETVLESLLFPGYAVLFDQSRRQFCSGRYSADSRTYSPGNEIPFFINYWTDQFTDRYWVLGSDQGVICMLPYSLETNFTKVVSDVDSEFVFELASAYEPNTTSSIIRQSPLFDSSRSCTLGLFQGCSSSEFVLSLPETSFVSGLELVVRGVAEFRTTKGVFSELIFYDKASPGEKLFHVIVNPDMIGIYFEKTKTQVWGELRELFEIGNMRFIYDLRVVFREGWLYVVSSRGQTLVASELPQGFAAVGKVVSSQRSSPDPLFVQTLRASSGRDLSREFLRREAYCVLSGSQFSSQVREVLGFGPDILFSEGYHLDLVLDIQQSGAILEEDLLLAVSLDELLVDPHNLEIQRTEYLVLPKLRIGIFKNYISLEEMLGRAMVTGAFPAPASSKITLQIQPIPGQKSLKILYKVDETGWLTLYQTSGTSDQLFNKIQLQVSQKHSALLVSTLTGGTEPSTLATSPTDCTPFVSPTTGSLCRLLPLSYCSSQDVSISVDPRQEDARAMAESLTRISNITIQVPNFPESEKDLMYRWRLVSSETALYELSLFQTSVSITNLVTSETVSGPPMHIISQYSENLSISLLFRPDHIFVVDSETNHIIVSVPNSKNLPIHKILASFPNTIPVKYYSSYSFAPGPKTTSTESSILNVLYECKFFNQCDQGNYICQGSSARQLCSDPEIMKLWYSGPLIPTDLSSSLGVFPSSLSVFTVGSQTNNLLLINVFESYIALSDPFSGLSCYNKLPNEEKLSQNSNVKFGVIVSNEKKVDLVYFPTESSPSLLCSVSLQGRAILDFHSFESNGQGLSSTIGDITMNTELDDWSGKLTVAEAPTTPSSSSGLLPYIPSSQLELELSSELKTNMGLHFDLVLDSNQTSTSSLVIGVSILNKYQDIHTQLYISGGSNPSVLLSSNIPGVGTLTNHSAIPEECVSIRSSLTSGGRVQFSIGVDVEIFEREHLGVREEVKIPYLFVVLCDQSLAKVPLGGLNIYKLVISNRSVVSSSTTLINGFYSRRTSSQARDLSAAGTAPEHSLSDYREVCTVNQDAEVTSYCLSSSLKIQGSAEIAENYELTAYLAIQDLPQFSHGGSTYFNGISYRAGEMSLFIVLFNQTHLGVVNLVEEREIWNLYVGDAMMSVSSWIAISVNRISGFLHFTLNDQIFASFPDYPAQHVSINEISLLQPGSWSIFQGVKQDASFESNRYPFMYHGFIECSFRDNCQSSVQQSCVGNSFSGLCPYPKPDDIVWLFRPLPEAPTNANNGTFGASFELPDLVHAYKLNDGFSDVFAFYFFKDYAAVQYLLDGRVCRNRYSQTVSAAASAAAPVLDSVPTDLRWGFYLGAGTISLLASTGSSSGVQQICSLAIPDNTDLRLNVVYPVGHFVGIVEAQKQAKTGLEMTVLPAEQESVDSSPCLLEMFQRCRISSRVQLSPGGVYFRPSYVFELTFTFDESTEYRIIFNGETDRSSVNKDSAEPESLVELRILGRSVQLSNSRGDISMADLLLETAVSRTTLFTLFAYLTPGEESFVLASSLDLETDGPTSRLRSLGEDYKGVSVPLAGRIRGISTDRVATPSPTVFLNNWSVEAGSLRPAFKRLTCRLDEVGPGSWCVGLNATYTQESPDWRLVWLNFTLSRDSQTGPSSFEYFDSYVLSKDGKKGLLELSFGAKELQLASLQDDGTTRAVSYYTNRTIVKPGDTVSIGIAALQDTPNQLYLCDQDSNVLLSVPFTTSELQGQNPNYIVNRREGVFSSFMLDSRTLSVNQTLVDGYGTCSFDSSCGLETLTCTGQALRSPCPRSTPGLHWMISSKLVDTGLSGGIWGREFALSGLLGSYMLLGDVQVKLVVHFFQNRLVLLDPAHGLSCSGPYISNKPAGRDESVDWTIGLDSSGMVFLGLFDQTTQKHHTVCGFRNFGQDVHLVAIVPVGSRPAVSVFRQFGKDFPQGGHAPTSSSENKYGFYHPVLNTTSQTYLPLVPYGQNAPFLPVGVPAIDSLGLSPPPGFFFNKTTSQYEPLGDSTVSGSLGPPLPFQLLEGTDSCDLEIYSLCNSTRVGLQAPMASLADGDWSLFAMVSTGIPTYPSASPPPELNFQFSFKDEQGQVKFSIKVSNSSVIISGQESRKIAEAVSPQCGPYCSTYPRGLFAFWLQKKSSSSTFTLGVDFNRLLLAEFDSTGLEFTQIEGQGDAASGPSPPSTHTLWSIMDLSAPPTERATTTTTSTMTPWQDQEAKSECPLELGQPCKGIGAQLAHPAEQGNVVWINTLLGRSESPIQVGETSYWLEYKFKKDSEPVISLLLNETSVAIHLHDRQETLSSKFTNQHLLYEGMEVTLGVAFNRFGLFLLNGDLNALLHSPSTKTLDYNKIAQESIPDHVSNFLLEGGFTYPKHILFRGYETCTLYEDCRTPSKTCESQVLLDMCTPIQPGTELRLQTTISQTNVNNGTWGAPLVQEDLLNVFHLGRGAKDLLAVYIYKNRIVLEDISNFISCGGPYPGLGALDLAATLEWSLALDSKRFLFLNVLDASSSQTLTVCSMALVDDIPSLDFISPSGYRPSTSVFTQKISPFIQGGHQSTSDSDHGYYFPLQDASKNRFQPDLVYGDSFPFFPPGVHPAPLVGNSMNTPPNYHYNSTTSQFEPNNPSSPGELNPFRPTHIVDGGSTCDLYLFSTCNATSARIMPENTPFKDFWTLFVISSTGIPPRASPSDPALSFNLKYEFLKRGAGATEEPVLSLTLSDDSVVFKNEKTGETSTAVSPQCGPYCSTYPGGFFAFWMTYDSKTKKYVISVENNSKKLTEVSSEVTDFSLIRPCQQCKGTPDSQMHSVWKLFGAKLTPEQVATTTTTSTKTPWQDQVVETCPISRTSDPCRGTNVEVSPEILEGDVLWIDTSLKISNPKINKNGREYWQGFLMKKDTQDVFSLLLDDKYIIIHIEETGNEYSSPYTNQSLAYIGRDISIGVGKSRYGYFILDENLGALITLDINGLDLSFNKAYPLSSHEIISTFRLQTDFLLPQNKLFIGYETCSINEDCVSATSSCTSQALEGICQRRSNTRVWTVEVEVAETHVNNGTWTDRFALDGLLSTYFLGSPSEPLYNLLFFGNRIVIEDLDTQTTCSGAYSTTDPLTFGQKILWSFGVDEDSGMIYFNTAAKDDPSHFKTVCSMPYLGKRSRITRVYPLGYAPSKGVFTQSAAGLPQGGFETTSSNSQNGGFYFPDKNTTTGHFEPENKYGESFPFYPLGVKPAPLDGDDSNTPPNYHYNSTTSQFEPNNPSSPG
ncbi:mucin-like protein, partial [Cryptosporidium canis]